MTQRGFFKPGSGGESDPDHMYATLTEEEIEQCVNALEAQMGTTFLRTSEIDFVQSMVERYRRRQRLGVEMACFTGKQLVWMFQIYRRAANEGILMLQRMK
jgi:hypothetical protein